MTSNRTSTPSQYWTFTKHFLLSLFTFQRGIASSFFDVFPKQFGKLSAIHSQLLVGAYLVDASLFYDNDHVHFWQDRQCVRRKHASLKTRTEQQLIGR